MNLRRRVLFCYISRASGHQRAADAVISVLRRSSPPVACEAINSISYANPLLGQMVASLYLQLLKVAPQVWDYLYDNPLVEKATRDLREMLGLFNTRRIARLLREHRPGCLVCTQAVPVGLLAALKEREKIRIPLVGIITDFGVHKYWISPQVDLYLVPSEDVRLRMRRQGVEDSRIRVTGIPVDPHFESPFNKSFERAALGLAPQRDTVLVMGGSYGLGPLEDAVRALRALPRAPQLLVVCGHNRRLFKSISRRFGRDRRVRVLGHSRGIHRLMAAADLLISKPGGLTMSEALARSLPVVMIEPIPGQEERNARYLLRHGAAVRADTLEELVDTVSLLLNHPARLARLGDNARALSRPHAARDAAGAIVEFLDRWDGAGAPA